MGLCPSEYSCYIMDRMVHYCLGDSSYMDHTVLIVSGGKFMDCTIHNIIAEKIFNEKAIRGNILDREGKILAINLIHKRINLDPMIIQDEYLEALAEALIVPVDELRKTIDSKRANNRKYFIVKKNLKVTDPILKNIARLKQKKQWLDVCEIKFVKPSLYERFYISISNPFFTYLFFALGFALLGLELFAIGPGLMEARYASRTGPVTTKKTTIVHQIAVHSPLMVCGTV